MGTKFVSYPRWTDRQDAALRRWFARGGYQACCKHVKRRSATAVYTRLRKLGLIKRDSAA